MLLAVLIGVSSAVVDNVPLKNSLGWVGGLTSHNGEIWDEGMTRGDTVDGSEIRLTS